MNTSASISLPVDMNYLNLPDQIYITFRTQDVFLKDGKQCVLNDDTDFVSSPPPEYYLSVSPSLSKEMRRGEDENVEVRLQSNQTLPFDVNFSSTQRDLNVGFDPEVTAGVTKGLTTSTLNIKVPTSLSDKSYNIPIQAHIQFRPTYNPGVRSFAEGKKKRSYQSG